jgi:ribose 5-phosphate isomerase B
MDRETVREQVRAVLTERLASTSAPPAVLPVEPPRQANLVSWRRFDEPRDRVRRALVTDADVMRARAAGKVLAAPADALVTPLARETAARLGVRIETAAADPTPVTRAESPPSPARKTVAIGADHGGFALKEALKPFVATLGFETIDLGTKDTNPVDYPDFAHRAAEAGGRAAFGIMIDGVGVGSAMAANRHRGIRAAPCSTTLQAQSAREHNDANVLTLGGRHLGEDVAKAIVKTFLGTPFAGGRHAPRVQKIEGPA